MFSNKKLRVSITHYQGVITALGEINTDWFSGQTIVFEDFKINCNIKKTPSTCGYTASVDIYGVSQESLDDITTIAWIDGVIKPKKIRIEADEGNGYVTLFEGGIMEAVPNYEKVPDVSIHIESSMLVYPNIMKAPPLTLERGTSIFNFCKALGNAYNISCYPELPLTPIFPIWNGGTKIFNQESFGDRLDEFCRIAELEYAFKTFGVRIYKKGTPLVKDFYFTPENYVGYPSFENFGISLSSDVLYDVDCGDRINVSGSIVGPANGTWVVNVIEYKLQTRTPSGVWQMILHGTRIKQ